MMGWWRGLDPVNQWFYVSAAFFSVFFGWQLIAALLGLAGGEEADVDADAEAADIDQDAHMDFEQGAVADAGETVAAFKLLSIRSILAFLTLFSWAGALYLNAGADLTRGLIYAICWGLGALLVVASIFHLMRRMTETGSPRIATCVGTRGTVHLDIPADGQGEARVVVSGAVSHVKARAVGGGQIKAGTPIRVTRSLGPMLIEVELVEENQTEKG